ISMREVLLLVGFEVVGVAATVSDALCLAENSQPDIAILDIRLAGRRDGIEGALLLRKQSGLPILFVTAQEDKATVARAVAAEAVAYLVKPINAKELIDAVDVAIRANSRPGTSGAAQSN